MIKTKNICVILMVLISILNKITEQNICVLIVNKHESFTCGEDLVIFSHVPAFLLPPSPAYYHIVAGRRICLHLDIVDTQMAFHPKPGIRTQKERCKYLQFLCFNLAFMSHCQQGLDDSVV